MIVLNTTSIGFEKVYVSGDMSLVIIRALSLYLVESQQSKTVCSSNEWAVPPFKVFLNLKPNDRQTYRERDSSNSKWHDSARQATNRHRSAAGDKKGRKIRYLTVQQGKRFRQVSTLILGTWFLRNSDFWGCHCNRSRLYEFDPNIPIQAWNLVKNLTQNLKYNL